MVCSVKAKQEIKMDSHTRAIANYATGLEEQVVFFQEEHNRLTLERAKLFKIIKKLRDYIANSDIPIEDSDRLYQEHLALADEALKNTEAAKLQEAKEKHCWSCDNALSEDEKGAYPIDVNETGHEPDIRFQCEECRRES